jgi:hypothetical protein
MAQSNAAYAAYHDSAGKVTNPTTAEVMADTGALPGALYEVRIMVGCSAAATFNVQHRNAANDGNVSDTVIIRAAAGQTGEYILKYALVKNERIRVLPEANITGLGEVTLQAIKVA